MVLFAALLGCAAPTARPGGAGPAPPGAALNLENLLRGGRLAELADRIATAQVEAERQAPEIVGLLLAAQGRPGEALRLLAQRKGEKAARRGAGPGDPGAAELCLPLLLSQLHLYQRGDAKAALDALTPAGDVAPCREGVTAQAISSLRARLVPLLGAPALEVAGPAGEQRLVVDRIAANAGYLVARVVFDRDRSGQFLLGTGFSDIILDRQLAAALRLKLQEERPMPVGDLPPLEAAGTLPTATVPQLRVGLLNVRNAPVLVADLAALRDAFRRLVSREVRLDGFLPLQRLAPRGYLRLRQRGTEVLVATSSVHAGPCRMRHQSHARLYHLGGALFTEAGLPGSPPLLMQLTLERRRSALRHSALRYAKAPPQPQPAQADVARPSLTEAEARERLAEVLLRFGEAELGLRGVPLLQSVSRPDRPADHGALGMDVPGEFDLMIDLGDGALYVAPRDRVSCD